MLKDKIAFSVDIKGAETEKAYRGDFIVKTKLSWREMMREDELIRQVLGTNPGAAEGMVAAAARMSAYLAMRITESPDWWKKSGNGIEMEVDLNVLSEVHKAATDVIDAEYKRVSDEAEKAKAKLKEESPNA